MNIQTVKDVISDWKSGQTHGYIALKHRITPEQEFGITFAHTQLSPEEIAIRVDGLWSGMKAQQIIDVMLAKTLA